MTATGLRPGRTGEATGGRLGALVRWQDWRLPVKLLAVILVPLLFLLLVGGLQIRATIQRNHEYARISRLVEVSDRLGGLLADVQRERTLAASLASGQGGSRADLDTVQGAVDTGAKQVAAGVTAAGYLPARAADRHTAAVADLGRLDQVRSRLADRKLSPTVVVARYTTVTSGLLAFQQSLAAGLSDPGLASAALAVYDVRAVQEEVRLQQAVVASSGTGGTLGPARVDLVRTSQARLEAKYADFTAVASGADVATYRKLTSGPDVARRDKLVHDVVSSKVRSTGDTNSSGDGTGTSGTDSTGTDTSGTDGSGTSGDSGTDGTGGTGQDAGAGTLTVPVAKWTSASDAAGTAVGKAGDTLAGRLADRASALEEDASNSAGVTSVLLFVAVILAAAVMIAVARSLLTSLTVLRRSARDAAERRLPGAVARIRAGRPVRTEVDPVPVHTRDEVGQLARAFEAVQGQALRLATEQAALRTNYRDVFVNLSRRSESLVQRQLGLIERLERDEEDPDQLAVLFQLDHLATRMRRNNENLMVLSGTDVSRRFDQPVPLADVLRAAVSEIEQYQRVVAQAPAPVSVVGYAASDLVRLLAEVLDNATTFSAPETRVKVGGYPARDGGVSIDILDQGIGMSDAEVATANDRLAGTDEIDVSTSRRMGLFVVGRLARRHGILVRLHGGEEIRGLRVTVTLPAALLHADGRTPAGTGSGVHHRTPQRTAGQDDAATALTPGPPTDDAGETAEPAGIAGTAPGDGAGLVVMNGTGSLNGALNGNAAANGNGNGNGNGRHPAATNGNGTRDGNETRDGSGSPYGPVGGTAGREPRAAADASRSRESDDMSQVEEMAWRAIRETTPIFDEMESAWFTADPTRHPDVEVEEAVLPEWAFAADEGFRAARDALGTEPDERTGAGLPRRRPRARLVPGSAASASASASATAADGRPRPAAQDDPEAIRGRLSGFRSGVTRARQDPASTGEPGLRPAPASSLQPAPQPAVQPVQPVADPPARGGDRAMTAAGLPRRTPRAKLGPATGGTPAGDTSGAGLGPVAGTGSGAGLEPARTPEDVSGRLASFQRGVRRGRDENPSGLPGEPVRTAAPVSRDSYPQDTDRPHVDKENG